MQHHGLSSHRMTLITASLLPSTNDNIMDMEVSTTTSGNGDPYLTVSAGQTVQVCLCLCARPCECVCAECCRIVCAVCAVCCRVAVTAYLCLRVYCVGVCLR